MDTELLRPALDWVRAHPWAILPVLLVLALPKLLDLIHKWLSIGKLRRELIPPVTTPTPDLTNLLPRDASPNVQLEQRTLLEATAAADLSMSKTSEYREYVQTGGCLPNPFECDFRELFQTLGYVFLGLFFICMVLFVVLVTFLLTFAVIQFGGDPPDSLWHWITFVFFMILRIALWLFLLRALALLAYRNVFAQLMKERGRLYTYLLAVSNRRS